jgi:hypothetical protein
MTLSHARRHLGVTVKDLDVLERHAEPVGDDLAERRLVALAVGARPGDDLDLAEGGHPDRGVLPAAGAIGERSQHPAGGQAAHLGEGRDADAQLDLVAAGATLGLLGAEGVIAEQLLGLGRRRLVVAGVIGQAGDRGEGELLVLDPVALPDLQRVDTHLDRELVHQPLDRIGRLGAAGATVGVGPGLVGQDGLDLPVVGRDLVDRVEHEGTEHRHAATDERDIGAEVGQQVDLEAGHDAVLGRREGQPLPLVAAVVAGDQRLRAGLGVLGGLAEAPGDGPDDPLLRRRLELAAEATANVGGDDADLGLGHPGGRREGEPQDVGDLRRRPHGQLLPRRVDDDRARLHERRDEALLAVLALDDDAVLAGLGDRLVGVAAGAGLGGVEHPQCALVGAEVGVGEHLVLGGLLEVQRGRQLVVLHVDELSGIACLGGAASDDHGDDLAGEGDPVAGHRRVAGGDLVGGDRPGVDAHAHLVTEVGARQDGDHVGRGRGGRGVDADDLGVGERAAHHREVQHARKHDVVGPAGATGDQPLVLLAAAGLPDLGGRRVLGGRHWAPPAAITDLTMLW